MERNAQRAGWVKRAEDWPWWSVPARLYGNPSPKGLLSPWPVPEPGEYREWLNRAQPKEDVEQIRQAIVRSKPYGSEGWISKTVALRRGDQVPGFCFGVVRANMDFDSAT